MLGLCFWVRVGWLGCGLHLFERAERRAEEEMVALSIYFKLDYVHVRKTISGFELVESPVLRLFSFVR